MSCNHPATEGKRKKKKKKTKKLRRSAAVFFEVFGVIYRGIMGLGFFMPPPILR
jgi:hypothetical protein